MNSFSVYLVPSGRGRNIRNLLLPFSFLQENNKTNKMISHFVKFNKLRIKNF